MLKSLDAYLIAQHRKHRHRRLYRFVASRLGFVITTLLALYQNVGEIGDQWEEGHYLLAAIFSGIGLLLVFFLFRHVIRHRRIEHFKYRLKILEAALVGCIGAERCLHFEEGEGLSFRVIMLAICTLGLTGGYLVQSRSVYLRKTNVISDGG